MTPKTSGKKCWPSANHPQTPSAPAEALASQVLRNVQPKASPARRKPVGKALARTRRHASRPQSAPSKVSGYRTGRLDRRSHRCGTETGDPGPRVRFEKDRGSDSPEPAGPGVSPGPARTSLERCPRRDPGDSPAPFNTFQARWDKIRDALFLI